MKKVRKTNYDNKINHMQIDACKTCIAIMHEKSSEVKGLSPAH